MIVITGAMTINLVVMCKLGVPGRSGSLCHYGVRAFTDAPGDVIHSFQLQDVTGR
ncbi:MULTISPECIES: hypothetical protein [Parvibaculum]|uniref:hypothetical protein n=1 Tax=Parvibaculum TaxID=256616 RepID=UPI001422BFB6|nr:MULTISPECIES: hypothetical protein [Parvibaculum]NIJ41547.1 hypothetical protein [Parvibaculum indicum]